MKEIYPMWKTCRILKENKAAWNSALIVETVQENMLQEFPATSKSDFDILVKQQTALQLIHNPIYFRAPRALRRALIHTYMHSEAPFTILDDNYQRRYTDVMSTIEHCIEHVPSFIKKDEADEKLIYLTERGESFADRFGLCKQYLIEMGIVWTAICALVVGLSPYVLPILIAWIRTW